MVAPEDYKSVGFVGPMTRKGNKKDEQLSRDREAYKRLRADGLQPSHIGGSAHLEKHATLPIEVEYGHVFKTDTGKALAREAVEKSIEMGIGGVKK